MSYIQILPPIYSNVYTLHVYSIHIGINSKHTHTYILIYAYLRLLSLVSWVDDTLCNKHLRYISYQGLFWAVCQDPDHVLRGLFPSTRQSESILLRKDDRHYKLQSELFKHFRPRTGSTASDMIAGLLISTRVLYCICIVTYTVL